jgi:adenylyltransferase/sulfurtransferase
LKIGKPLIGQFMIYNSLEMDFKSFAIKKNPSCPLCSREPKIKELLGYGEACRAEPMSAGPA